MITVLLALFLLGTVVFALSVLSISRSLEQRLRGQLAWEQERVRELVNVVRSLEYMIAHPNEPVFSTSSAEPLTSTLEKSK